MELPSDIALLWGLRTTSGRGRKPSLTLTDITRAAVEVADAEGLAAVSMARVAAQLGNATMALYRHVRSKDELLALMSDAAFEAPPALPPGSWRDQLTFWAHAIMANLRRHPWYVRLPISGPPAGPNNLAWLDRGLATLASTALDEGSKLAIVLNLTTFLHGQLRLTTDLAAGYRDNPEAFSGQYSAVLKALVDPRTMPALGQVVSAGVFDADNLYDEGDIEADFAFGLNLYLDGVAAHIERVNCS